MSELQQSRSGIDEKTIPDCALTADIRVLRSGFAKFNFSKRMMCELSKIITETFCHSRAMVSISNSAVQFLTTKKQAAKNS
jgi:hypothetical protein